MMLEKVRVFKIRITPKSVLKALLLLCVLCFLSAGIFTIYCISGAPDISGIDVSPEGYRTTILDRNGNVLLTLSGQESNRVYVKFEDIPEDLVNAFVAIEDARFFLIMALTCVVSFERSSEVLQEETSAREQALSRNS